MIYAFAFPKGGTGKTSAAVHWATNLARTSPTLLIDGDPQESSSEWARWRAEHVGKGLSSPVTTCLKGKAIYDQGKELAQKYENTVIDAGGRDSTGLRNTLLLAQRVIVPMKASGMEGAVLAPFLEIVEEARSFNPDLEVRVVSWMRQPSSKDSELREFIQDHGVKVFDQSIADRRVYQHAVTDGLTVEEYRPRIAAATYELSKLYEEIMTWS